MALRIGIPSETAGGEKRVATVPDVVEKLIKLGFTVAVQSGAGEPRTSPTTPTAPPAPRWSTPPPNCGPARTSSSRCAPPAPPRWR